MVKVEDYIEFGWSDEALIARYISDEPVSLEIAKAVVKARLDFAKHQPHKLMISFPKLSEISKEAREYLSSEEGNQFILAGAMVTPTLISKMMVNFFLNLLKKDEIQIRMFDSEIEALYWLKNIA